LSDRVPNVFLSSTFYDLRQVRADLTEFLERDIGYRVLASELGSFPVDANADTLENCRRRVEDTADMLVLVVGGRYGAIPPGQAKSVTNIEYLAARAKGIPILAFIAAEVLTLLPVWESSPEADYSSKVEDTRVFQFIRNVRNADAVWSFSFSTAQDIVGILRKQLAYHMTAGLTLRARLGGRVDELSGLSGRSLRLALDQAAGWQGFLFAQVLSEEIACAADARLSYEAGLSFGPGSIVSLGDAGPWAAGTLKEARQLISGLTRLVNETIANAVNSSDIRLITYGAREVGRAYKGALDWAARVRRAAVPEVWEPVTTEMARFLQDLIEKLAALPEQLAQAVAAAIEGATEPTATVQFAFVVKASNVEAFQHAMAQLEQQVRGCS
jgi:hypothetical protein